MVQLLDQKGILNMATTKQKCIKAALLLSDIFLPFITTPTLAFFYEYVHPKLRWGGAIGAIFGFLVGLTFSVLFAMHIVPTPYFSSSAIHILFLLAIPLISSWVGRFIGFLMGAKLMLPNHEKNWRETFKLAAEFSVLGFAAKPAEFLLEPFFGQFLMSSLSWEGLESRIITQGQSKDYFNILKFYTQTPESEKNKVAFLIYQLLEYSLLSTPDADDNLDFNLVIQYPSLLLTASQHGRSDGGYTWPSDAMVTNQAYLNRQILHIILRDLPPNQRSHDFVKFIYNMHTAGLAHNGPEVQELFFAQEEDELRFCFAQIMISCQLKGTLATDRTFLLQPAFKNKLTAIFNTQEYIRWINKYRDSDYDGGYGYFPSVPRTIQIAIKKIPLELFSCENLDALLDHPGSFYLFHIIVENSLTVFKTYDAEGSLPGVFQKFLDLSKEQARNMAAIMSYLRYITWHFQGSITDKVTPTNINKILEHKANISVLSIIFDYWKETDRAVGQENLDDLLQSSDTIHLAYKKVLLSQNGLPKTERNLNFLSLVPLEDASRLAKALGILTRAGLEDENETAAIGPNMQALLANPAYAIHMANALIALHSKTISVPNKEGQLTTQSFLTNDTREILRSQPQFAKDISIFLRQFADAISTCPTLYTTENFNKIAQAMEGALLVNPSLDREILLATESLKCLQRFKLVNQIHFERALSLFSNGPEEETTYELVQDAAEKAALCHVDTRSPFFYHRETKAEHGEEKIAPLRKNKGVMCAALCVMILRRYWGFGEQARRDFRWVWGASFEQLHELFITLALIQPQQSFAIKSQCYLNFLNIVIEKPQQFQFLRECILQLNQIKAAADPTKHLDAIEEVISILNATSYGQAYEFVWKTLRGHNLFPLPTPLFLAQKDALILAQKIIKREIVRNEAKNDLLALPNNKAKNDLLELLPDTFLLQVVETLGGDTHFLPKPEEKTLSLFFSDIPKELPPILSPSRTPLLNSATPQFSAPHSG